MDPAAFTSDRAGRLLLTPLGYQAFVPSPLPPAIQWGAELVRKLSEADRAVGHLRGAGSHIRNPWLLIRPFLTREAVLSSRIEGTQASISDLFYFEAAPEQQASGSDVGEVANYINALNFGLDPARTLPLSLRLIRELHARLMDGVRGAHLTPGDFRTSQNWIGQPMGTLNDAAYVPPSVTEMRTALADFEAYLHARDSVPPLVRLGIIHYQFEAIHPFLDGNGRIGRLLITLLLAEWHILETPLLYLSAFFERRRQEYYDHLLAVSQRGEWEAWLGYFLEGVASQAADASQRASRLSSLRDELVARVTAAKSTSTLPLIDHFMSSPVTTVPRAAAVLNLSYQGAQANLRKLEGLGIVRRAPRGKRPHRYLVPEVLALLDDAPPVPATP